MSGADGQILEWFREYHGRVLQHAWRLTGCWDEAEDVASQVFLRLAELLRSGCPPHQPLAWLFRSTGNAVVSLHRRRMVRRGALGEVWAMVLNGGTCGPASPEAGDLPEVRRALFRLRSNDRQVLVLRYDEELETSEMARILRLSESSVRSRLARALQRLRWEMGVNDDV